MADRLIDDNGATSFADDNGVECFVDDLGNYTCQQGLMGQCICVWWFLLIVAIPLL